MATSKPPIKCTPCRVQIGNKRYRIYSDGSVSESLTTAECAERGIVLRGLGHSASPELIDYEVNQPRLDPHSKEAKEIRREAARLRRNRNARERNQAMRDLGLVKTPYGWE